MRRRQCLTIAQTEARIEVSGLRKRFGPTVALDGMTFTVPPGQLTGFAGPNGAGKSTTATGTWARARAVITPWPGLAAASGQSLTP
jgi:ABC-type branched-subunit amino acid transport system ATPase component